MNVTRDDIAEAVKTDTKPQSLIISIKATTDNKDKSILIANTTAAAAKNIIPKFNLVLVIFISILKQQLKTLMLRTILKLKNIQF